LKEAEKRMTVDGHDNDSDAVAATAAVEKNEEACTWGMTTADYSDEEHEAQHQNQQQLPLTSQSSNNTTNLPSIDTFFSSTPSSKYTISNPLQQLYNQYQTKSYKLDAKDFANIGQTAEKFRSSKFRVEAVDFAHAISYRYGNV
jgi:hypothetical protein